MSVIDILTRVNAIVKEYEKYDVQMQRDAKISGNDAFMKLYSVVEADLELVVQKSDDAQLEKNRATIAAINAEIRRAKATLREQIPKLSKLAVKKVKGLTKEELAARPDLVIALEEKIESIPDGVTVGGRRGKQPVGARTEIKIDGVNPDDIVLNPERYQHSEESKGFRQEYDLRKAKQDEGLEHIALGLDTLKNMALDINEELDRQAPLVDEIDAKVDRANADLRTTNKRLKETVTALRSSRNFCIDIILLAIVLGIAAYLYNVLK
eukprot:TRINITY_DN19886_c0_g1_i1.p1 TRINITY_DN19886_c0_g1~~TRINITY_DN19886_c0_g1_i1.p1  ORF type:complete len:267 (+),score=75.65 TRINITY_DN19886_c0_g1_i1:117-917(+)